MKPYPLSHITTVDDVRAFFRHLAFDCNLSFHPDDDFSDYSNRTSGEASFTADEVKKYNALMKECHAICHLFAADIYEIGLNVMRERMGIGMR